MSGATVDTYGRLIPGANRGGVDRLADDALTQPDAMELETVWTLAKRDRVARCVLLTHQLGWELRIPAIS